MKKFSNVIFMVAIILSTLCSFAVAADSSVNPLNLEGDTLYLLDTGSFAVGLGSNIATIEDVVEIRAMIASEVDKENRNLMGIGIGVNIPNVIKQLGGKWLDDNINSSFGITALTNVDGKIKIEPAVYLTILSVSY